MDTLLSNVHLHPRLQGVVAAQRHQAQEYLHGWLGAVPPSVDSTRVRAGAAFRMQRAAAAAPQHGPRDLVALALPGGPLAALQLNPFLSAESGERLQQGARTWLQLCVLEDRLARLAALAADPAAVPQLIQVLPKGMGAGTKGRLRAGQGDADG